MDLKEIYEKNIIITVHSNSVFKKERKEEKKIHHKKTEEITIDHSRKIIEQSKCFFIFHSKEPSLSSLHLCFSEIQVNYSSMMIAVVVVSTLSEMNSSVYYQP